MRHLFFITAYFIAVFVIVQEPILSIGQCKEHLPYKSAMDVSGGDGKVYSSIRFSLFSVNISGNTVESLSRVTGLNETGLNLITYDEANSRHFIADNSSNTYIIYGYDIFNVPDIKQDNKIGDQKHVYYLSAG